jgi:hypothetical protein
MCKKGIPLAQAILRLVHHALFSLVIDLEQSNLTLMLILLASDRLPLKPCIITWSYVTSAQGRKVLSVFYQYNVVH